MIKFLLTAIVINLLLFSTNYAHTPTPNTILMCLDGISRNTFYALIQKNRLPNIAKIIKRGNYRNMEAVNPSGETLPSYVELITGYNLNIPEPKNKFTIPENLTIFEKLKQAIPDLEIGIILSTPQNLDNPVTLTPLFSNLPTTSYTFYPEIPRSDSITAKDAVSFINTQTNNSKPFFLFLNFTDTDFIGHRYREGAASYSQSIKNCDLAIGKIINYLENKGIWNNTNFFITTNYGFTPKTNSHKGENKIWITSSCKIRFKGTLINIAPTIYHIYGLEPKTITPALIGKSLVY